jgi:hypothetical protein
VKHSGLNHPVDPAVYAPFAQSDEAWRRWMTLAIRTPVASARLIEDVKKQVWSVDSQIPVSEVYTIEVRAVLLFLAYPVRQGARRSARIESPLSILSAGKKE